MTESEIDRIVLRVLAGQSDDYLIRPDATAFVVEGLDSATVEASLGRLAAAGHAAESEIVTYRYALEPILQPTGELDADDKPILEPAADKNGRPLMQQKRDDDGEPILEPALDADRNEIVLDGGWAIEPAGRDHIGPPPAELVVLEQDGPSPDPTPPNVSVDPPADPAAHALDRRIAAAAAAAVDVAAEALAPGTNASERAVIVEQARQAAAAKLVNE